MYYAALLGEDIERARLRYKRSGIIIASTSKNAAIRAAQFLFPARTKFNILSLANGGVSGNGYNSFSYWNDELRRDIPNWFDLSAYDRKTLHV